MSTDFLWMSRWGLFDLPDAHFLNERPLQILHSVGSGRGTFQVPPQVESQAYNPSVLALPQSVRAPAPGTVARERR